MVPKPLPDYFNDHNTLNDLILNLSEIEIEIYLDKLRECIAYCNKTELTEVSLADMF